MKPKRINDFFFKKMTNHLKIKTLSINKKNGLINFKIKLQL